MLLLCPVFAAGCGSADQELTVPDPGAMQQLRGASAAFEGFELAALASDASAMQLAEQLFAFF